MDMVQYSYDDGARLGMNNLYHIVVILCILDSLQKQFYLVLGFSYQSMYLKKYEKKTSTKVNSISLVVVKTKNQLLIGNLAAGLPIP